jgi:hypothetical protein
MSTQNTTFQTVACDGPNCKNSAVIEATDQAAVAKALTENPWLKVLRTVISAEKRGPDGQPIQYNFCSDVCMVNGATARMFDEQKILTPAAGSANAQIKAALEAKAKENAADAALRAGAPVNISPK